MHCKFIEFLVVRPEFPTVFFHFLAEICEAVGVEFVRVARIELLALLFCEFDNLRRHRAGQFATLAEDHTPHIFVHHRETRLVHRLCEQIHQSDVLYILTERRHQRRIADARPNIADLVEELDQHFVVSERCFSFLLPVGIDGAHCTFEIGHH